MAWDSNFSIETIRFFGTKDYAPIDYQYIIRKKQNTVAEYFRHDDSSFLFVEFDSINRLTQRGPIKICSDIFNYETIQIPDVDKDPNLKKGLFKDTVIANISFRKNKRWKETDTSGKVWIGEYVNGKREGIWNSGVAFFHLTCRPKL